MNNNNEKLTKRLRLEERVKFFLSNKYQIFNNQSNLENIGKTLNQETILYNLKLTDARVISASGFSADDFEGLYVTDSKRNPVMYIDVGLGECKDGTSWSFSGYPNGEDPVTARENVKGLMLEID